MEARTPVLKSAEISTRAHLRLALALTIVVSCQPGWMWEDFRPSTWLNDLKWLGVIIAALIALSLVKGVTRVLLEVGRYLARAWNAAIGPEVQGSTSSAVQQRLRAAKNRTSVSRRIPPTRPAVEVSGSQRALDNMMADVVRQLLAGGLTPEQIALQLEREGVALNVLPFVSSVAKHLAVPLRLTRNMNPDAIERFADVRPAPVFGPLRCFAGFPGAHYSCTLASGHEGPHVAHGGHFWPFRKVKVMAVWD